MNLLGRQKIVLLGMMGRMRVAGGVWQTLHYLAGFERLGFDVYYVEAHGSLPWAFGDDEVAIAAFIDSVMQRFGFSGRWAFHARSGSGNYYGLTASQVRDLYQSAAVIINLHGGTLPTEEQSASGRLIYVDTDPVAVQVELHDGLATTIAALDCHCAFFTFGENYGNADCKLPVSGRFPFKPTRQPVVLDWWTTDAAAGDTFTTIGNWQQLRRAVDFEGDEYLWSKHFEFLKFLDLPQRLRQRFELALSSCDDASIRQLQANGWNYRDAFGFSQDLDAYRDYIQRSRAEFTVAKDQNIRFRSGWFSDRSATYLASGRPVITQDTGFGNIMPTGEGLFGFSGIDDITAAVDAINSDYDRHHRAAISIARECFSHDVVLTRMLSELGIRRRAARTRSRLGPVNVVGDFHAATGMGAVAARYAGALETAGIFPQCVNIGAAYDDATLRVLRRSPINLICCDVAAHFTIRAQLGEQFFRNRYNIGVWLWELPAFPPEWHDRFAYYDEIWAPSSFIASVLSPVSPVPVVHMPMVLQADGPFFGKLARKRLGIEADEFLFAFIFNFHSRVQRKNPLAVIDAFRMAFRADERARLIIKCVNGDFDQTALSEMQRLAQGHRISICDGAWPASHVMDLIDGCDCYVSLHRGEGVGLTISDAMALGKPVIATGWSGNMDFMNVTNSYPISYRLVELDRQVAFYKPGDLWAEPSIEEAAAIMRRVFDQPSEAGARGDAARSELHTRYSYDAVAPLLTRRIELASRHDGFSALQKGLHESIPDLKLFLAQFSELGDYLPQRELQYAELKRQLKDVVSAHVPHAARLIVVSKGDDDLLQLDRCSARHFPQDERGHYAGYYPQDSAEAIRNLESLRVRGADFLLFPQTAFWWLEHYTGFRQHLLDRYPLAHRDESCLMFDLRQHAA